MIEVQVAQTGVRRTFEFCTEVVASVERDGDAPVEVMVLVRSGELIVVRQEQTGQNQRTGEIVYSELL